MNKVKVKKAVAYVRVSSDAQIDNTSISNQVEKIKDYCRLYDITLSKVFSDEGISGSSTDRQGYNEMMEYIKNNEVNALIAFKSDRIHRKLKNLMIMLDELEHNHISFISVSESFDTSTCQGMLFLQMLGSFSEFERSIINERTKSGRIKKAKDGRYSGGRVPFGYRLVDSTTLEIDEIEAESVNTIFHKTKQGLSTRQIARELMNRGITPRSGKDWSSQSVQFILKNRVYCGEFCYDGAKERNNIKFSIPRIISKQLYNQVNKKSK